MGKRDFSTLSRRAFIVTLPCMYQSEKVTKFIKDKNLNPIRVYDTLSNKRVRDQVLN